MGIYLTDESAQAFWSAAESVDGLTSSTQTTSLAAASSSLSDIKESGIPHAAIVDRKLHVLVGNRTSRRNSTYIVSHVCEGDLPRGSFRRVSDTLMVASPEFMFVRMARKLSLIETIRLGFELCGTYVIRSATPGQKSRQPLTTVSKLRHFAERASSVRGYHRALAALKHVIDGSNSPMETVLVMLLCLPCRYGGFGLPRPLMNRVVKLGAEQARAVGRVEYRCDLYWEESSYALEYYGREWHTGIDQVAYDARRQSELQSLGIEVAVVTYEQLETPEQVEELAKKVAGKVGVRLRKPNEACIGARAELHRRLIGTKKLPC